MRPLSSTGSEPLTQAVPACASPGSIVMTDIHLKNVSKSFGSGPVLDRVGLSIQSGEFVAVLGPSGCGKTTLLRLIAGFETPDSGEIALGGRVVSGSAVNVPPEKRDIGIVFQNYALWPHMSVAENLGYALKVAGMATPERQMRVDTALETVGLTGFGARRPADLSGGQRQRVALGRCLASHSSVVLLDEPLANLDVHLRASMEEEFSRFHENSGATMVYITHDQAEAMALADRVAVMDQGRLMQIASPRTLYREPDNEMVAAFIGDGFVLPVENVLATMDGNTQADLFGQPFVFRAAERATARTSAFVSLHPQDLKVSPSGIPARITRLTFRGGHLRAQAVPDASPAHTLCLDLPGQTGPSVGDRICVSPHDGWVIPAVA